MIEFSTSTWQLQIPLSVVIAGLAFLLSIANFVIILWDRRSHLTVGIENVQVYGYDDELGYMPEGYRIWIDIVNRSSRRVMVSHFVLEWKRSRFSRGWAQVSDLPDLQPGDKNAPDLTRFWIEPWGDAVFSLDADELASTLKKWSDTKAILIRVAVSDALKRVFTSNRLTFHIR